MTREQLKVAVQLVLAIVALIAFLVIISDVQDNVYIKIPKLLLIKAISIIILVGTILGIRKLN